MNIHSFKSIAAIVVIAVLTSSSLTYFGLKLSGSSNSPPVNEMSDEMSEELSQFGTAQSNRSSQVSLPPVEEMIAGLRTRLESEPGDIEGWLLLAKSYAFLKRWKEANEALDNAKSQGYSGNWRPLPSIDSYSDLENSEINSMHTYSDLSGNTGPEIASSGNTPSVENSTIGITLLIDVSAELKSEVSADAPVFVFARDHQIKGPPLAVAKIMVKDLPAKVTLDDSDSMIPGKTISGADEVVVGARISTTGEAIAQPGDYQVISAPIASNYKGVFEVIIDSRI